MANLDDVVRSVVQDKVQSNELFTALDVSNKVKETLPFARHREVRDVVRSMFTSDLEPAGWARTPITVTLADGSTADALLYHPLSDAWDLDAKYDAQKRAQFSAKASPSLSSVAPVTMSAPVPVTPVSTPAPVAVQASKDLWAQLFNAQPSLFPRR